MIRASSLAFPGGKSLTGWWRALLPYRPVHFWVGHLFVHRLEALAEINATRKLEPLPRLVLTALALDPPADHWLARLDERLHLGPEVLRPVLRRLEAEALLRDGRLTELGKAALTTGEYASRDLRRRDFSFVERPDATGQRKMSPHFLPLATSEGVSWPPPGELGFECDWLGEAVRQPAAWRMQFRFPAEVCDIVGVDRSDERGPAWQRVIVDRTLRLLVALVQTESDELLAFGARQEAWQLQSETPILKLPASCRDVLPDLARAPTVADWRAAWLAWCQGRGIASADAEACRVSLLDARVRVESATTLHRRLQLAKNEAVKGDAWLLEGDGYVRAAKNVDLIPVD